MRCFADNDFDALDGVARIMFLVLSEAAV